MVLVLKEELLQLCDIRNEIKEIKIKIDKLELKSEQVISDSVESTTKSFPFMLTHERIEGIDVKKKKRLEHYKNILEERYEKLLETQLKVEEFIDNIPTSRLRRIFTFRYIDQLSWDEIAAAISSKSTADSVRLEHNRFLKK